MYYKILIVSLLAILSLLCLRLNLGPQRVIAEEAEIVVVPEVVKTPKEYITQYASQYEISEQTLMRVAVCESGLKINAVNYDDGGKGKHSVGVMQFQESTFLAWEKKIGIDLDYYSYHDQIRLAAYMFFKNQGPQWTCYRML